MDLKEPSARSTMYTQHESPTPLDGVNTDNSTGGPRGHVEKVSTDPNFSSMSTASPFFPIPRDPLGCGPREVYQGKGSFSKEQ